MSGQQEERLARVQEAFERMRPTLVLLGSIAGGLAMMVFGAIGALDIFYCGGSHLWDDGVCGMVAKGIDTIAAVVLLAVFSPAMLAVIFGPVVLFALGVGTIFVAVRRLQGAGKEEG